MCVIKGEGILYCLEIFLWKIILLQIPLKVIMSSFNIIRAIILLTLLMVSFSTFSYIITKITLFQTKKRAKSLVLSIGPIIHLNMCFYVLLLCIYVCWWRCSLYAILFCIWMLNTV